MGLKSLINNIMGKKDKTKEKTNDESKPLVGKKITTKSKKEDLLCDSVKLNTDEKHTVIDESINAVITDKSNGAWISKQRFQL